MRPETLELSRKIGALPGAPVFRVMDRYLRVDDDRLLDTDGVMWTLAPDRRRWILDLDSAATGGAMLPHCGWVQVLWTNHDSVNIGWGVGVDQSADAPTLAAALARVLVARGRWS